MIRRLTLYAVLVAVPVAAAGEERVTVRAGLHPGFARIVFDWPRAVGYEARVEGGKLVVRFAEPFSADFASMLARVPNYVVEVERPDPATARIALRLGVELRHFLHRQSVVFDLVTDGALAAQAVATAPTPLQAPPPPPAPAQAQAPVAPPAAAPVPLVTQVAVPKTEAAAVLGIKKSQRAASFRRDQRLWLVFDAPERIDLDALSALLGGVTAEQIPTTDTTVLLLHAPEGVGVQLEQNDDGWRIKLAPEQRTPLNLRVEVSADNGGRVRVRGGDAGPVVRVKDPSAGDVLWIAPMPAKARGVDERRQFAEFDLLPTGQGVAVMQRADGLKVAVEDGVVAITAEEGLRLSDPADRRQQPLGLPDMRERLFGRALPDGTVFIEERRRRQAAVVAARGENRLKARYDLARYLLANGFASDAQGVLDLQLEEAKGEARSPNFLLMRGVARFVDGDYADAAADLRNPLLATDAEAGLWRAALSAAEGDFVKAAEGFAEGAGYLSTYPDPIRQQLLVSAAEAALETQNMEAASGYLESLARLPQEPGLAARLEVLRGRLRALEGNTQEALAAWDKVAELPSQRARAEAEFARTELMLAQAAITPEDAIMRFDRLRFAWRGDDFELAVLARLGELRLKQGMPREGLLTLKSAAELFPGSPRIPALTERMRTAFRTLYLDGAESALPPIAAIALYEEFRELVPGGPEGDKLVETLIERLVSVDLLDRAASLADHLIGFRLASAERARMGARLGEIRLMQGDAQGAINALEASTAVPIDPSLSQRRRFILAEALSRAGRHDDALKAIAADQGEAATRLKAQIQWRARDWLAAAASLRALAGAEPAAAGEKLTDARARDIAGHALALYLAGDEAGLSAARRDFSAAMAGTKYADEFRVYAGDAAPVRNVAELRQRVNEVELFRSLGFTRPRAR